MKPQKVRAYAPLHDEISVKHHVVMYSSGISSWAAAKRVAEKYGTENLTLLFADTKIEDEDNYRFLHESAKNVGGELVIVSDGRDPWQVFIDTKWINHRSANCSLYLKIKPCENYLKSEAKFNPENTTVHFGIDWQEFHRMEAISKNWFPYSAQAPLCWGDDWLDKNRCLEWCSKEEMRPPKLYELGFSHSNCGGFCVKAGKSHFRNLLAKLPDVYKHHEEKEQIFRQAINRDDVGILREQNNGIKKTISLKKFRQRIEKEPKQLDLFDEAYGGCGCFTDA